MWRTHPFASARLGAPARSTSAGGLSWRKGGLRLGYTEGLGLLWLWIGLLAEAALPCSRVRHSLTSDTMQPSARAGENMVTEEEQHEQIAEELSSKQGVKRAKMFGMPGLKVGKTELQKALQEQ